MQNKRLIHPAKPPILKCYRAGRTCRNCVNAAAPGGLCLLYQDSDTRNPRARALRCRMFEHWDYAFDNILSDSLRKS